MEAQPDVIVVGGGPAGSSAAIRMLRTGRKIRLYEKAHFPRAKLCGGFLGPEGIAELEDLGILPQLLKSGARPLNRLVVASPQGTQAETPLAAAALSVSRETLDGLLLSAARREGVDVRFGADGFTHIHAYPDSIVVLAAGRHTYFRDGETDSDVPSVNAYFALQALFEDVQGITDQVELDLLDSGYVGVARQGGDRYNICALTTRAFMRRAGAPALDAVMNHMLRQNSALRGHLQSARRVTGWLCVGPVRVGLHRLTGTRSFYVGDAAYVVDPFAGEGMSVALGCSRLLAQALAQSERPAAEVYSELWRKAFLSGFRWDTLLRGIFGQRLLREPLMHALREFPSSLRWFADATRPRHAPMAG